MVLSSSLTQPLFGALADRLGRRKIAAAGVVLNAALLSLVGIAPTFYLLIGTVVLGGLGAAALHPAGSSLASTATGVRQLAVSLFSAGGMIGVSLGPVLVLLLVESFGLAASGWLMIPGVVLGLLMLLVIPESTANHTANHRPKLLDLHLLATPVGGLVATAVLVNLATITFSSAVPLWLVTVHGYARDATLLGWTLTAFALAAALGGVLAGWLSSYVVARHLATVTLLASAVPLLLIFHVEPGSIGYFLAVILGGAFSHAGMPYLVVAAQDLAPNATATASGLLMGFAAGGAGLLYIGIGWLQEIFGLMPAMQVGFWAVVPAALLASWLLSKTQDTSNEDSVEQENGVTGLDGCLMAGCES
jgi:FSR family fosmidomycin resistance protein-like MFS transporter